MIRGRGRVGGTVAVTAVAAAKAAQTGQVPV
jgi:hypothetical protein